MLYLFYKTVLTNERSVITISRKKALNVEIKQINHTNIFQYFLKNDNLTKQNIVSSLQLCLPTVTQNITELIEKGLIQESGSLGNTGGRRAKTYSLVKNCRVAIGLDITKNHVTAVAVDITGAIITKLRHRIRYEASEAYYRFIGDTVSEIIKNADLTPEQILGVGIGLPGLVTADGETVFYGKILNFTGSTREEFSQYIPYPSMLFNDANAAAYTETWSRPELKNVFYLMLSNNIGGSIVIDNKVYMGDTLKSGEVGHIPIIPNGKKCYCGQSGCVDGYLAATELSNLTDGNLSQFFQKLDEGDAKFQEIWDNYLDYLARTVNTVNMLFDCTIILGGYVGEYIEPYIPTIRERANKLSSLSDNADYLIACSYKTESIAAGAALNYISSFINSI